MTDDPRFAHDKYFIRQLIRPMVNQYEVSQLGADGKSDGAPVCFVQQKRMAFKEDLRFYTDNSRGTELFRIKARQVWDPNAKYDVTDASGAPIGALQKQFAASLLRSKWKLYGASGSEAAWAEEKSTFVALYRRFAGMVPFVGGILEMIPLQFHFTWHIGDRLIGEHSSRFGPRDVYVLDLSGDPDRQLDRRLALAFAVGLDALQAR